MKLSLPDSIASPQDLNALILDVREYAKWYSHNAAKKRIGVNKTTEKPLISQAAEEILRTVAAKQPLSTSVLDDVVTTLQKHAKDSPHITITLAAPPTLGIKKELVAWCRQHLSESILVNFRFNAVLCGGMVVQFGSHIYDWSMRRQILDSRAKFPEVLRRV